MRRYPFLPLVPVFSALLACSGLLDLGDDDDAAPPKPTEVVDEINPCAGLPGETRDVALLGSSATPRALRSDGAHLYVAGSMPSALVRVSVEGGALEVIDDRADISGDVAVDDAYVYWLCPGASSLCRRLKSGGETSQFKLTSDVPQTLAADGLGNVFIQGASMLWKQEHATDNAHAMLEATGARDRFSAITADRDGAYFIKTENGLDGLLHRIAFTKDSDQALSSDPVEIGAFLTTDETFLYGRTDTILWRAKKSGGRVFPFAWTGIDAYVTSFIVDHGSAYWVERRDQDDSPRVLKQAKSDFSEIVTVAEEGILTGARLLAQDTCHVYWVAERGGQKVLRSRVKGNDSGQWRGQSRTPSSSGFSSTSSSGSNSANGTPVDTTPVATCLDRETVKRGDGTTVSCAPYVCALGACLASCGGVADCASGAVCDARGVCIPALRSTDAGTD